MRVDGPSRKIAYISLMYPGWVHGLCVVKKKNDGCLL